MDLLICMILWCFLGRVSSAPFLGVSSGHLPEKPSAISWDPGSLLLFSVSSVMHSAKNYHNLLPSRFVLGTLPSHLPCSWVWLRVTLAHWEDLSKSSANKSTLDWILPTQGLWTSCALFCSQRMLAYTCLTSKKLSNDSLKNKEYHPRWLDCLLAYQRSGVYLLPPKKKTSWLYTKNQKICNNCNTCTWHNWFWSFMQHSFRSCYSFIQPSVVPISARP